MKLRKVSLILVITIAMLMIASIFSASYAATGSKYLKLKQLRASGYGYQALEKNVWKIVETDSNGTGNTYKTIYCLKGGPGFNGAFSGANDTSPVRHYTQYFDMKNPSSITSEYTDAIPAINSTTYKSLVWLLDNVYVAPLTVSDAEQATEYREELLKLAGISGSSITDDDIDVVQQLAVWYFTNNAENDPYKVSENNGTYNFELCLNAIEGQNASYKPLSDEQGKGAENGYARSEDCKLLFKYLVDTAKSKGEDSSYKISNLEATKPYQLDKTLKVDHKTVGNNYVIGPFKINKISDTAGTLTAKFYNGNTEIMNPTMQDVNGKTIATIEDTVGKEFYISIPTSIDIENIKLEISGSYFNTSINYWAVLKSKQNDDQPVVEVERTRETYNEDITYTPAPKQFDLALRKFITSINGKAPTVSREPKVDLTTLKNGTFNRNGKKEYTATYTHPKNALEVKTGDKVIYTIRVYNEGEIDAYVKEVTDYLPEGLKLAENSTINTNNGWTNPSGDGKTIVTSKLGKTLLKAFDGTNLKYLDVQIECEVTAKGTTTQSLKNIAEITAHSDSKDKTTVTDRDSTPNDVNRNTYGTTSQEDDDDYEQLIVPGRQFDLALRKFITSINGIAPTVSREPKVDLTTLKNGTFNRNGKKEYTATYTHPKNALEVKTGDKVIYTIRVYNEGEIDAYVKEVTDYLPEGLKLAENSTINTNNGWTNPSGDGKTIVTSKLGKTLLKAFDGTNLKYLDVQIECEVTAKGTTTQSLKNIAEITAHSDDQKDTTVADRDSTPNDVNRNTYGTTSQEDDDDYEQLIVPGKIFDLALRKFITSINGKAPAESREPEVDLTTLKNGTFNRNGKKEYTATYTHPKNALEVKTGDKVIYTIRVYNEGEADAYVKEVTDYLPDGLKLAENSTINTENGWTNPSKDSKTIVTSKLGKTLLKAFNGTTLEYLDVQIECEVTARGTSTKSLKNIAEITAHSDSEDDTTVTDRDSTPNDVNRNTYGTISQEDDDDYEQLIIVEKKFDLALRKFITAVGKKELVDENGKYIREPKVDVTPLLNNETTAIYEHSKTAVSVDVGDEVTYTLRVYNEGETDGYADEITDYLPEWLEFVNDEFNAQYGWKVSEDGRKVSTTITSKTTDYSASRDTIYANRTQEQDKVLLKAFDKTKKELDYIDVKIKCKVKDTGIAKKITNIAEITKASDDRGNTATDIDSKTNNITLPKDDVLPNYKDDEIESGEKYIPGQEDDDDFEKVIVQKFDLSLRKFITAVNSTEITERVPVFSMDSEKKFTYTHPKTPVEVVNGDVIVYTLRVYNEGNQAGYADEVKDNLPEGLVYLPENEINKEYRWKLYKEDGTETTEVSEAKTVRTDYLSRDQEIQTKRNNLLKAFNTETMTQPDYREVKIAFKVTEPNTSDRIIINTAEISKDSDDKGNSVEDIDSTPDNDKEDEDDIDIEKVKVKYFDLALEKIVSEYSIKQNGKTTVTKTGHKFGVQPEPPVKVELVNSMVKSAVIKFKYQIKVTNEGEIAGYAEEVKDYIPSGLKFVKEDNSKWTMLEDGNTVTTDQLKDKLLQPGESAVVEITLQWINGQNNFGLKQNWAEISKDKNDSDSPDIDSVPNNKKEGEDDIDDASVLLSVKTGSAENYIVITGSILAIVSAGIVLIKKFVI